MDNLSVPTICIECKTASVKWIEDYCSDLEADVSALRDKAEGLLKRAKDGRRKAEGDRRAVEQEARDAERFERSAERSESEADGLWEEARVRRQFVEQLRMEIRPDNWRDARGEGQSDSGRYDADHRRTRGGSRHALMVGINRGSHSAIGGTTTS